ncbi:MAG: DnaA regulatory inactivator Hda [Pseudohongiellaceae bacterium]
MSSQSQMTLPVELNDDARFENFYVSAKNKQLLLSLKNSITPNSNNFIYLWGGDSSGKSHLLQALCHQAEVIGKTSLYLSCKDLQSISPEVLEGAQSLSLVCIDDAELISGLVNWEQALFTLFNQLKESDTAFVLASNASATDLTIGLADLKSRIQSMLVYNLFRLDDEDKKKALQLRAAQRGFQLPDLVADFILARAGRGFSELMSVLDTLDSTSLVEQRKLTVPLVKTTLGW